jgi:septum formation protein
MAALRFVLASASPARLETLRRAGLDPEVVVSEVDEDAVDSTGVAELASTLATIKARVVASRLDGDVLVLGCDSLLEFEGEALGKPGDAETAARRWRRMRGKSAVLHTGHCLVRPGVFEETRVVSTTVTFASVSEDEIAVYVASGEPLHVAGGFTLDGLGGWFVEAVTGDPHNVVGVSLPTLRAMLRKYHIELTDIGYPNGYPDGQPNSSD